MGVKLAYNFSTEDLQERATRWVTQTFPGYKTMNPQLRGLRFGEEAIELMQTLDIPKEKVLELVEYVYSRPVGELDQELAGALITLSLVSASVYKNMGYLAQGELIRVENPEVIEEIRKKNKGKVKHND